MPLCLQRAAGDRFLLLSDLGALFLKSDADHRGLDWWGHPETARHQPRGVSQRDGKYIRRANSSAASYKALFEQNDSVRVLRDPGRWARLDRG